MINLNDLTPEIDKIKLVIYDFDGVMTNNKVYIDHNGYEMVQINRADGLGIAEIKMPWKWLDLHCVLRMHIKA